MARTEFVPAGGRGGDATPPPIGMAAGEIKPAAGPADRTQSSGTSPVAAQKGKGGGIPWNDSPKMPAQFTPMPIVQSPPALQSPPPAARRVGGRSVAGGRAQQRLQRRGNAGRSAMSSPGWSVARRRQRAARREVICATCGKPIAPGFAFCGSCGTRVARSRRGGGRGGGEPRTMFMGGPGRDARRRRAGAWS